MTETYTITEAKAKLSELISRAHFGRQKFMITRKGKAVAVVLPVTEDSGDREQEGLIRAKAALSDVDAALDGLTETVYKSRLTDEDRKIDL